MGSSQSFKKDPNVDIFMQLEQPIYYAGSKVQGNIYLNVKNHIQYDALYLRLEGREYVFWTQNGEKDQPSYSNDRQSYLDQFIVNSFSGSLSPGHYTFPFIFYIPNQMTGSLWLNNSNFIKYTLKGYLTSFQKKNDNQTFSLVLNVVQLLRNPYRMIGEEQTVNSFCCGCCCSYGKIKFTMTCEKNFAITGDKIKVYAQVDASQSTSELKNCKFVLSTNFIQVSSDGTVRQSIIETHVLYAPQNGTIKEKSQENYSFIAKIPQNIRRGTTIGNVLALWYTIDFISEQGCCNFKPPKCSLHLVINPRKPIQFINPVISHPPNWNPQVYQMMIYSNMKPYVYSPVQGIPVRNSVGAVINILQPGYNNIEMQHNSMGQPPTYFNSPPTEQSMINKEY